MEEYLTTIRNKLFVMGLKVAEGLNTKMTEKSLICVLNVLCVEHNLHSDLIEEVIDEAVSNIPYNLSPAPYHGWHSDLKVLARNFDTDRDHMIGKSVGYFLEGMIDMIEERWRQYKVIYRNGQGATTNEELLDCMVNDVDFNRLTRLLCIQGAQVLVTV
jgi:hypothetical protein